MKRYFDAYWLIGASLVLGAMGILGWIDETTMIVLLIVLISCAPGRNACWRGA